MGTKQNPGKLDCYTNAMEDEPMFVLLARDPDFYRLVQEWALRRKRDIDCGDRPESDNELVKEAYDIAQAGAKWRRDNLGKWRRKINVIIEVL